jgi:hypothetical protein
MKKFSHRHGFDPNYTNEPIREDAPEWLKRAFLTNILSPLLYVDGDSRVRNEERRPLGAKSLSARLAAETGIENTDEDLDSWYCSEALESRVLKLEWYQFYDFLEFVSAELKEREPDYEDLFDSDEYERFRFRAYRQSVNDLFSEHKVQWRLGLNGLIEAALPKDLESRLDVADSTMADDFEPARRHYAKARLFVLSPTKDPENSIKEAVSAMESVCRTLYPGNATLGACLKAMRTEAAISPMLISVFEKFYAYASAEPAVRHGSDRASRVLEQDAELALHFSAAFIRTLIERKRAAGR